MQRKIIETGDGSKTLFIPEMDEQYHSVNGAITESEYVYLDKGYRHNQSLEPVVLEIGFGTGLNALLTALEAEKSQRKTTYISLEKYPLKAEEVKQLNYGSLISEEAAQLFEQLHTRLWNSKTTVTPFLDLLKIEADLKTFSFDNLPLVDIIYYDAFGPDKQPEMWEEQIFKSIFGISNQSATLVTYSAKGEIRRRMERSGFTSERLPGPPGKRQMLRVSKL
ncbi:tRNA (5-methylaminomethyl-2-thiouridine)(34)-methyltransferase MnmD [Draconibacterium sp. IB214405]|uniref:tRNA (5-methylaminomethyl-2-thiouridine)(34)-methyltransferase MnmD n=1 Tax=Draconibacterium sp. IB214405 TaxID=3097352 RepID=UPI002A15E141|nr:tRNA (5-methylaminomethyl-2-thiouridine)(34)-methyltransferase MnmD [Draconibacterium sp. IB214405]MDX8340924.1 tRNA (5-methylaminomethyl-2-thiouridine)(34)-methyltransferase MnmD [Draconibacterium sp. IB214405]